MASYLATAFPLSAPSPWENRSGAAHFGCHGSFVKLGRVPGTLCAAQRRIPDPTALQPDMLRREERAAEWSEAQRHLSRTAKDPCISPAPAGRDVRASRRT